MKSGISACANPWGALPPNFKRLKTFEVSPRDISGKRKGLALELDQCVALFAGCELERRGNVFR